jgi:hypothetical protein
MRCPWMRIDHGDNKRMKPAPLADNEIVIRKREVWKVYDPPRVFSSVFVIREWEVWKVYDPPRVFSSVFVIREWEVWRVYDPPRVFSSAWCRWQSRRHQAEMNKEQPYGPA